MRNIIGRRFYNKFGNSAVVVEYYDCMNATILFEYDLELTKIPVYGYNKTMKALRDGVFRGPYCKTVQGVGYMGIGPYGVQLDSSSQRAYKVWLGMLARGAGDVRFTKPKLKPYWDVEVSEEWYCFQNFAKWYNDQIGCNTFGWELDKDLFSIAGSSKLYSPDTCVLMPREINISLPKNANKEIALESLENFRSVIAKYEQVLSKKILKRLKNILKNSEKLLKNKVKP